MAGVTVELCGALYLFRFVVQQFSRTVIIEPRISGLEPNRNTPGTDRPKLFQNRFQGGYGPECFVEAIARKSILALIRNGKDLSLLLPSTCWGGEVARTKLTALADLFGGKPLGIFQYGFECFRLHLSPADVQGAQLHSA